MTNEEFEQLVEKLEKQALAKPKQYLLKVYLLAILGNLYLAAILGLVIAIMAGMLFGVSSLKALAVKGLIVSAAFLWLLLKAIWIRIPAPEGRRIHSNDAPELFAMLEELGNKLNGPRFHEVLLVDDFNAAVVQSPRLGVFGFYKNYLMIGLPLLKTLSKEQFKSVLAHEFGHLAKGHGRHANWIYRSRLRWARLIATLEANQSGGSFLFTKFFNWYAPYFSAYSFPLARASEYEADAAAAQLTSPQISAQALTNVNVIGCYLQEKYWPKIHKQVQHQAMPNFMPFSNMNHGLIEQLNPAASAEWLERVLQQRTSAADTHPALHDRLRAIHAEAELAPPTPDQAADCLLGENFAQISNEFDLRWQQQIQSAWQDRFEQVQKERQQLARLEEKFHAGDTLSLDEKIERACFTESLNEDAAGGLDQFRAMHEEYPDNAHVKYLLACRLLDANDETGYDIMRACQTIDPHFASYATRALRDYFARNHKEDLAKEWEKNLIDAITINQIDERERNQVTLRDSFETHGLSTDVIEKMRVKISEIREIKRVYLVRKKLSNFTDQACYVLAFSTNRFFRRMRANTEKNQHVTQALKSTLDFPGETLIIHVDGSNHAFGAKFKKMADALIL